MYDFFNAQGVSVTTWTVQYFGSYKNPWSKTFFTFSFGLGSVYSKQEKYDLAQIHYGLAEKINPNNVIILCHIGVVEHALQKTESALKWFGKL